MHILFGRLLASTAVRLLMSHHEQSRAVSIHSSLSIGVLVIDLNGLRAVCVISGLSIEKARFLHQLSIDANKVSYVHEKRVQL